MRPLAALTIVLAFLAPRAATAQVCGNGVVEAGEACDDGNTNAGDCCDGACAIEAAGTTCRAAAGTCDLLETCDGVLPVCPADQFRAAGDVCRAAADLCDEPEVCSGQGAACPADGFVPAGMVCRATTGDCDPEELCDGATAACPADARTPAGTTCRAAAGTCDVAEACDGVAATCPADAVETAGTTCRPVNGACDVTDVCDGASAACPADGVVAAGTTCRASAGVCDVAEACNGVEPACPTDTFVATGTECRASTDVCDPAEQCTGADPLCPNDATLPNGTPCPDGVTCNGTETCVAAICTAAAPLTCDDANLCTTDTCTEPGGCGFAPVAGCCNVDPDCERKKVHRAWTDLEQRVLDAWEEMLNEISRSYVSLAPRVRRRLRKGYESRKAITFREREGAPYREWNARDGQGFRRQERSHRTAAFLLRLDELWPDGPGYVGMFGMDGTISLVWAHLLRRKFSYLLEKPGFTMVELSGAPLPERASRLDFCEAWEVDIAAHEVF